LCWSVGAGGNGGQRSQDPLCIRYNIVSETALKDAANKLDSYLAAKQIEADQRKDEIAFGEKTVKKQAVN